MPLPNFPDLRPFGGPYSVEELRERHNLDGVALEARRRCIEDPLYLASKVCSRLWQVNLMDRPSSAHREVAEAMVAQESIMYVDARGTAKTTLLDEVGGVHQLLSYPDDSLLFLQASGSNAEALISQVGNQFKFNPLMRELFPEYAMPQGGPGAGSATKFTVPCRRVRSREESVEVGTPGASLAGRHYDVIFCSDVINENTAPPPCGKSTIETMKSLVAWYAQTDGLLKGREVNPRAHKRLDCLTGDTPVLMADGSWKPIRDVRAGESVPCWNGDRGWAIRDVTFSGLVKRDKVLRIRTDASTIRCSGGHKFLVLPGDKAQHDKCNGPVWRRADEIGKGDRVVTSRQLWAEGFGWARVKSVEDDGEEDLYDLTVDEHHNYIAAGFVVHNSNRWHDGDLVGNIIRNEDKKGKRTFRRVIRGVVRGPDGLWVPTWPEVKTPQMLADIHDGPTMNPATWAANFCSDPLPEGGLTFVREWFHEYGVERCPSCNKRHERPDQVQIAITVDAAWSDGKTVKKKNSRSAIVVSAVGSDHHLYVLQIAAGQWSPHETVERLFQMAEFWRTHDPNLWVGIEDVGGSRGMIAIFESEMLRTNRLMPYRKMKPLSASKDSPDRIGPLHSHAQHFGVFVRPEHGELVEELLRFGVAERNDLADAFAYRAKDMYANAWSRPEDNVVQEVTRNRVEGRDFIDMKALLKPRRPLTMWERVLEGGRN